MNILYIAIASILMLLLAGFASYLFLTIMFNVKAGMRYRESLARKVHDLRLSKMLTALGIDTYEYLHREKVVDIQNQMNRCAACENTDACDENLAADTITTENIDYCNNEASLKDMLIEDIETSKHPAG